MRTPERWAIAVRAPDGGIHSESHQIVSPRRSRMRFVRGPLVLGDAVRIGIRGLQVALRISTGAEPTLAQLASTFAAIGVGFAAVFVVGPGIAVGAVGMQGPVRGAVEGALRVGAFVGYLLAVSRSREAGRLFAYHGAEHKVIAAFEHLGRLPSGDEAREPSPVHPRCGTSFLTLFVVVASVVYAFAPAAPLLTGAAIRVVLAPLVAGVAFEVMRTGAEAAERWWGRALTLPGRMMQRITTREPTDSQLAVAHAALAELLV